MKTGARVFARAPGPVVHLDVPLAILRERLQDLPARGVVGLADGDLAALFAEREPLFRRWADIHADCGYAGHAETVARIRAAVSA